ncbi:MAG: fatty acid CoA ligase family protein [Desulforhopalus sp.]|nr:fatty acid CoA ligase family protein [Desulforhopalus sp.]
MNIAEAFVEVAEKYGNRQGIIEAKTGKTLTFAEINYLSNGYCNYFCQNGVSYGDIVILMVTPSADFICLTLALFKIGAPVVLIDPGMGFRNLLRCIERVEPRILVGIPKAIAFSKIFAKPFHSVKRHFCCGNSFGLFGPDIRSCAAATESSPPVHQPGNDDLAAIIFTTGSTGPPKGVRYEHSIFSAQRKLISEYFGIDSVDIDQPAFPLFALFSAALGACSVIPDMDATKPAEVDPAKFVASIEKYQVTYSFGSPAIWNVVSRHCQKNHIILQSIRKVLMAGAPVPYELLQRVTSILPPDAEIFTPYGATESLPIASIAGSEILSDTWLLSRQGRGTCVGRALPGIDIRIMTISDGPIAELRQEMLLEIGVIGEIIVRGDVVTRAYQNNSEETHLSKMADGNSFWHRMGDVGYLDEQHRLWFCGRRAHRVLTETGPLYTIPCEAIINEHPDVYRSALVGIMARGEKYKEPVIIIEVHKERRVDASLVLAEVKSMAGKSPLTKEIKNFLIHDAFPVDIRHNAKIFREKLAIWAQKKIFPGQ